jgi:hypothetical protein
MYIAAQYILTVMCAGTSGLASLRTLRNRRGVHQVIVTVSSPALVNPPALEVDINLGMQLYITR